MRRRTLEWSGSEGDQGMEKTVDEEWCFETVGYESFLVTRIEPGGSSSC